MEMSQASFNLWMDEFFNKKFNNISYSNQRYPKRMEKVVLDLSVAPSQPIKIPVPFKSCLVSRIYSTSVPTTDKAGSVKVLFDYDNLMNVRNAINLFVNDSFVLDTTVAQSFLTWTAQADTTVEIYFFVDLDYRAGTTKTQIVGTVAVSNSSTTSLYTRPDIFVTRTILGASGNTRTLPAGVYGKAVIMGQIRASGDSINVTVGGTIVYELYSNAANIAMTNTMTIDLKTGDVVTLSSLSGGATCRVYITEYTL